jgi:hypothetical protein
MIHAGGLKEGPGMLGGTRPFDVIPAPARPTRSKFPPSSAAAGSCRQLSAHFYTDSYRLTPAEINTGIQVGATPLTESGKSLQLTFPSATDGGNLFTSPVHRYPSCTMIVVSPLCSEGAPEPYLRLDLEAILARLRPASRLDEAFSEQDADDRQDRGAWAEAMGEMP